MAEPMRIRAQVQGTGAFVRVLMNHEMESGQRKDAAGRFVPAWHITEVSVSLNGKPAFVAEWGPAVGRNPLLQFTLRGARAGDRVAVTWRDNRGASRTDEVSVT